MKKYLSAFIFVSALFSSAVLPAKPAFTGRDYSGVYECTGNETKEGA